MKSLIFSLLFLLTACGSSTGGISIETPINPIYSLIKGIWATECDFGDMIYFEFTNNGYNEYLASFVDASCTGSPTSTLLVELGTYLIGDESLCGDGGIKLDLIASTTKETLITISGENLHMATPGTSNISCDDPLRGSLYTPGILEFTKKTTIPQP